MDKNERIKVLDDHLDMLPGWQWPEVQYRRKQTRKGSLLETLLNIGSGFMISWAMWTWVVAPLFEYPTTVKQGLGITILFTVTSVVRSYLWRRGFERWLNRRTLMSGTRTARMRSWTTGLTGRRGT